MAEVVICSTCHAFFMCLSLAYLVFSKLLIKHCTEMLKKINSDHFAHKITTETKISLKEHKCSAAINHTVLSLKEAFGGLRQVLSFPGLLNT